MENFKGTDFKEVVLLPGRKPKLNAAKVGHHNKADLERAELKENGLKQFKSIEVNNVPRGLTRNAKKEWQRVVPLLEQLPIADLDYSLIRKYCEIVDLNDRLYKDMSKEQGIDGAVDPESNRKTGAFMAYMDTLKELRSICSDLGMTIDSRMRLVVPTESEQKQSVYDRFGVDDDD
ncbi:hypothetical protein FC24_GL000116 [Loigolactobacillus rennini DSM 20253]|uniref:Uncharacterized protein n=2 Tax=Loigolactobacillus rennini TaxID=238013 RepID=A0A0R2D379_9LACO|nr:hypothetical protein FC24_GL000116 [Loigolactobacillus rennini DSM 20253]